MNPNSPQLLPGRVRRHVETHPGFFWLELEFPQDFPQPLPGQYLNLRVNDSPVPLFRRPFGVVEFRREADAHVVELFYAVIGSGTQAMSRWRVDDEVDVLGPLGTPYTLDLTRPALLVAGGRGAAPLLYVNRLLRDAGHPDIRFAFGARSASLHFGLDRLNADSLLLATDDGSAGHHGNVLDAISTQRPQWLADQPMIYACGPEILLRYTAALAAKHDVACQVSLEGVYGCGLGLCRGCAVPLKDDPRFLMQCIEGPVVDAARIDWDRMPHE